MTSPPDYLDLLPDHPLFASPSNPAPGRTLVAVRASDVVALVAGELRLASLVDVKAGRPHAYRVRPCTFSWPWRSSLTARRCPFPQVLACPHLKPPTHAHAPTHLVLSPSAKLALLWSAHSLVVVVLPRPSPSPSTFHPSSSSSAALLHGSSPTPTSSPASAAAAAQVVACKTLALGSFVHAHPSASPITAVLFHPYAHDALLVLTLSGTLFEYSLSPSSFSPSLPPSSTTSAAQADPTEPTQTLALLPPSKPGRFSSADPRASEAVALALGEGSADWGPLTVYVGTRDGDVRCLCPFVPTLACVSLLPPPFLSLLPVDLHADLSPPSTFCETQSEFPQTYLASLRSFTSSKLAFASSPSPGLPSCVLPPPADQPSSPFAQHSTPTTAIAADDVVAEVEPPRRTDPSAVRRYSAQLEFVDALLAASSSSGGKSSGGWGGRKRTPAVQGPLGMRPAPASFDEADEEDGEGEGEGLVGLVVLPSSGGRAFAPPAASSSAAAADDDGDGDATTAGGGAFNTVVTVSSSGKLVVLLELDKPEAVFSSSTAPSSASAVLTASTTAFGQPGGGGRRLLLGSASTSSAAVGGGAVDAVDDEPYGVPTLTLYETASVPVSSSSSPSPAPSSSSAPPAVGIVKDPIYADTVYLMTPAGLFVLRLSWTSVLSAALALPSDVARTRALARFASRGQASTLECLVDTEGRRAVESLAVVQDVYLGYGLVVGLEKGAAVGVPLDLRVGSASADDGASSDADDDDDVLAPPSDPKASYHTLLTSSFAVPSSLSTSRPPAPKSATGSPPLGEITPAVLRALGKHALGLREVVHEVGQGAKDVQVRVDLQLRELSRQAEALAGLPAAAAPQGGGGLEDRLQAIKAGQEALVRRADRVLQRAVDGASPAVSASEREWFAELAAMGGGVGGLRERVETVRRPFLLPCLSSLALEGRADAHSPRSSPGPEQIKDQLAALEPQLARPGPPASKAPPPAVLGKLQLARLEDALAAESVLPSPRPLPRCPLVRAR